MITNKGVELMGKYIAGQLPIFASHVAIGCGPTALTSRTEFGNYENKDSLDLEMTRLPITSRTLETVKTNIVSITDVSYEGESITYTADNSYYVGQKITISGVTPEAYNLVDVEVESADFDFFTISGSNLTSTPPSSSGGTTGTAFDYGYHVVHTAEAPESDRYAITEIGIYPAEKSNISGSEDSRFLNAFDYSEPWLLHLPSTSPSQLPETMNFYTERLDSAEDGVISVVDKAFFSDSQNVIFSSEERLNRQEQPRYLSETLIVSGDLSGFAYNSGTGKYDVTGHDHVQIDNLDLSFIDNASVSLDELRVAFSILSKDAASVYSPTPSNVKILIEISDSDDDGITEVVNWAQIAIIGDTGSNIESAIDSGNRYVVSKTKIKDIKKSAGFTWASAKKMRIYVDIDSEGSDYLIAFDAIKFENLSAIDSQYGLAGYTVLVSPSATNPGYSRPIIKQANGISFIEFRFALDIGGLSATSYSS